MVTRMYFLKLGLNDLIAILLNIFIFGGAKRSCSDRECKYLPIGMDAREPLWH